MSKDCPNEDLERIIALSEKGLLPIAAREWADKALCTVMDIQETIDSMQSEGHEAPTINQSRALSNIYEAACRWLEAVPADAPYGQ